MNTFEKMVATTIACLVFLTFVMTGDGIKKSEAMTDDLVGCVYHESSANGVGFMQCPNDKPAPSLVAAVTGGVQ